MLSSMSLHRKEAVFQNDTMTSPLLQNNVQTFLEATDNGVQQLIVWSPEHLDRSVVSQKTK